jgi:MSHA biogenesis protein MshI
VNHHTLCPVKVATGARTLQEVPKAYRHPEGHDRGLRRHPEVDLLNIFRRKHLSARRTGVACTPDSYAIATVGRSSNGRYLLESCLSAAASPVEQTKAIEEWFATENHRLGAISSVLDPADYELLQVESPDVLPAEFKAAIRWRLKGAIDFPAEDAVIDVFDMPGQAHRGGSKMMYVVAAKRQAIERQTSLLKSAARHIDVVDIPELALRNLAALLPESEQGLILLWLLEKSAQLIVIKQKTLYFARHVHLSGDKSADADAELPEVEAIALELQRSTDYFESQFQQAPLVNLIIAPRSEYSTRLAQALSKQTSMRVQSIDLASAMDLATGAALREDSTKL